MSSIASRSPNSAPSDDLSAECQRVRACLSAFVDGEATASEATEVLAHVSRCAACQHAELGLRHLIAAIQRSHVPVLASRRLQLRVTQLFADQEHRVSNDAREPDRRVTHADQS
jgi:anti-sigma factor RsiW